VTAGFSGVEFRVVLLLRCRRCQGVRAQLVRNEQDEVGWYVAEANPGRFRNRCGCDRELPEPEEFAARHAGRIDRERRRGRGPVFVDPHQLRPDAPFQIKE